MLTFTHFSDEKQRFFPLKREQRLERKTLIAVNGLSPLFIHCFAAKKRRSPKLCLRNEKVQREEKFPLNIILTR